jgi:alcohol dehydrogenase class IV
MTEVLYSENAIHHLPDIVHENGWKKVLLVTGKKSFEVSGADLILPALENVADVLQWSDFAPNTDSADVVKGLAVLRNFAPDAVIAVGGGSVMDMAKLLCAYTDQQDVVAAIRSNAEISGRKQALVLVPHDSGFGQ